MIKIGSISVTPEEILKNVSELDILHYYFGVDKIQTIISSPLRPDNHPSFGFYSIDGQKIHWTDLATKDKGGTFDLLGKYWGESYNDVLAHVWEDLSKITKTNGYSALGKPKIVTTKEYSSNLDLQCKTREWREYDLEYWASFGITLEWLKYADIYILQDNHKRRNQNGLSSR